LHHEQAAHALESAAAYSNYPMSGNNNFFPVVHVQLAKKLSDHTIFEIKF
jgi:hypothetical protein